MQKSILYSLIFLCWLPSVAAQAQKVLTLDEALQLAQQQNKRLQASKQKTEYREALRRTAVDLPKTQFNLMCGQYNSDVKNDNNISVSQNFAFPTVYARQAQVAEADVKIAQKQQQLTQQELARQVKQVYYALQAAQAHLKLLQSHDSLLTQFVKAATLRYETGETNYLEKITAETQQMEIRNLLMQAATDTALWQNQLQLLLYSQEPVTVPAVLLRHPLNVSADSLDVDQNPQLAVLRQETEKQSKNRQLEQAKLLPDFTIGYFNQTLVGIPATDNPEHIYTASDRFLGFEAGIAIPLWFRPQQARIKAAKIQEQIAQTELESGKTELQRSLAIHWQQYQKQQNMLTYYEKNALPQAELILKNANSNFKEGAVDYVAFVQALQQVFAIRSNYINALQDYNQAVIDLEFITGR